ncbi:MAG: A/G-specific adenine glycosylase [Bdellovibrionales bacterium]|nr:A/G-specific adenine glycosylase [Bdellovibrionales bacterium]
MAGEAEALHQWFQENSRPLPWRKSKNPYRIWISEVMLQQTTVTAVVPYFKKFTARFPDVKSLAQADLKEVYEYWAGLGYYSRARNLHKSAQALYSLGQFPKNYNDLIQLPGFGDYTSRAVSSQAFSEPVGVVDGNVIRVLSRRFGLSIEWWKTKEKKHLQEIADHYASLSEPSIINQSLMELGSTICRPQNPSCLLCPLKKNCIALKQDRIDQLPLKKAKRQSEIWLWKAEIIEKGDKLALVKNEYAPFLKGQLILPGEVKKQKLAPKEYDFQHAITHHKIYVQVTRRRSNFTGRQKLPLEWIYPKQLKEKAPFSLIQKAIDIGLGDRI